MGLIYAISIVNWILGKFLFEIILSFSSQIFNYWYLITSKQEKKLGYLWWQWCVEFNEYMAFFCCCFECFSTPDGEEAEFLFDANDVSFDDYTAILITIDPNKVKVYLDGRELGDGVMPGMFTVHAGAELEVSGSMFIVHYDLIPDKLNKLWCHALF